MNYWSAILALGITSVCCAQSLRQAADRDGVLVGTAVRPSQLSEPAYASTLAREFNMVEAEDAMKWWVLRPDQATYDFRQGDEGTFGYCRGASSVGYAHGTCGAANWASLER